jgi:hypothetical protein
MELIVIVAALTIVSAFVAWTGYRAGAEAEKTLRVAIEKGLITDPAMILEMRQPAGLRSVERFILLGIMVLVASGGIVLVALIFMVSGSGTPTPLFALAVFSAALGLGLIGCGRWLRVAHARP